MNLGMSFAENPHRLLAGFLNDGPASPLVAKSGGFPTGFMTMTFGCNATGHLLEVTESTRFREARRSSDVCLTLLHQRVPSLR